LNGMGLRRLRVKPAMTKWVSDGNGTVFEGNLAGYDIKGQPFYCDSRVIFFFFIFTFRMGGYTHFNALCAPSHIPQYAVEQYGLFRSYLLAHILLTKKLAIAPF